MKTKTPLPKQPTPAAPLRSIRDIHTLHAAPFKVAFTLKGQPCEIEVRKLTANESALLQLQLGELIPPLVKGKTDAEDRYDYANPDFLRKKLNVETSVRDQAVFWATPDLQKEAPDLLPDAQYSPNARMQINDVVRALLPEEILVLLYDRITASEVSLAEQLNFT